MKCQGTDTAQALVNGSLFDRAIPCTYPADKDYTLCYRHRVLEERRQVVVQPAPDQNEYNGSW